MRRSPIILASVLLALTLAGCRGQDTGQVEYIGLDAAKTLALEAAGVPESSASFTTTGLDKQNGLDYYVVDFTANGRQYEYDIDAITGVVIDSRVNGQGGGAGQSTPADGALPQTDPTQTSGAQNPAAPPSQPVQTAGTGVPSAQTDQNTVSSGATVPAGPFSQGAAPAGVTVTQEEAKAAALSHAGLTSDQVTFIRSHLDWERGRQVYDVEFFTSDYKEYDYEIDASTGEVISYDFDAEFYMPPASGGSSITAEQAKELALSQVPGATVNDIYEFSIDYDDGRLEYEGSIFYGGMEYEFGIDGYSGAIQSWEVEPVYGYYH